MYYEVQVKRFLFYIEIFCNGTCYIIIIIVERTDATRLPPDTPKKIYILLMNLSLFMVYYFSSLLSQRFLGIT